MVNINFNKNEGETLRHDEWNALGEKFRILENKIEESKGTKINFPNDSKKFLNGEGDFSVPTLKTINVDSEVTVVEDSQDAKVEASETEEGITLSFSLPKGDTGKVYVPTVDEESGDLSWSLQNNPQDVDSTNIKGPQGERGVGLAVNFTKSDKVTTVNITTDAAAPQLLKTLQIVDGNDGHNPCLGRFSSKPSPMPTGQVGDYLYVDAVTTDPTTQEETTTTTVYHYDSNGWDNGKVIDADNPTFASSQEVTSVAIKDLDGNNDQNAVGILGAKAGVKLNGKIGDVNAVLKGFTLNKINVVSTNANTIYGSMNSSGTYATSQTNKIVVIPLSDAKSVRFLGVVANQNQSNTGYAFGKFVSPFETLSSDVFDNSNFVLIKGEGYELSGTSSSPSELTDIEDNVPEGATHLVVTLWLTKVPAHENAFYCSLYSGETVKEMTTAEVDAVKIESYDEHSCYITFYGNAWKVYASPNFKHIIIPVTELQSNRVNIKANNVRDAQVAFIKEELGSTTKTYTAWATGWNSIDTIPAGSSRWYDIPNDAVYLYVYISHNTEDYTPESITRQKVLSEIYDGFNERLNKLEGNGDIFDFNPDKIWQPIFEALNKPDRNTSTKMKSKPVVFSHISDTHGTDTDTDSENTWSRFVRFSAYWKSKGFIADMVHTGDIVIDNLVDKRTDATNTTPTTLNWFNNVDGAENILRVVGNHDSADGIIEIINSKSVNSYDWQAEIGKPCYNAFFANDIANWGVTHGGNSETYYYKDYTRSGYNLSTGSKDTLTLRAIFVDVMAWGYSAKNVESDAQKEWLESLLVEAANNGYYVVIFAHYMPMRKKGIDCSYNSLSNNRDTTTSSSFQKLKNYNPKATELAKIVRQFQDGSLTGINANTNGMFIGYIGGHRHFDGISIASGIWDYTDNVPVDSLVDGHECIDFDNEKYPQIEFIVGKGNVPLDNDLNDFHMVKNTETNDDFQIISIDMVRRKVSLAKVGCKIDAFMRKHEFVTIDTKGFNSFDETNINYTKWSVVSKDGELWRIMNPVVVYTYTDWELTTKERYIRLESDTTVYPEFSKTTIYTANDIVSKDNELWKLTNPHIIPAHTDWKATDKIRVTRAINESSIR